MNNPKLVDVMAVLDSAARMGKHADAQTDPFALAACRHLRDNAADARAAVENLVEAAQLSAEWVNGSWYVQRASGAAWSNRAHGDEDDALAEAADALADALAPFRA